MATITTHYDNLKVARNAPPEVIRAAYKALAQQYHPDRNSSPDAPRIMRIINRAYEVLSDPDLRGEHDAWIATQTRTSAGHSQSAHPCEVDDDPRQRERTPVRLPEGGQVNVDELAHAHLSVLRDRVRDKCGDQARIPLSPSLAGFAWRAALPLAALVVVAISALDTRWHRDSAAMLMWAALPFGLYFGAQAYGLFNWFTRPLRPSLIATPLYLIETSWSKAVYWPIHEIRIKDPTRHIKNGSYTHTSFNLLAGEVSRHYSVSSEHTYIQFANRLIEGLQRLVSAEQGGDQSILDSVDELLGTSLPEAKPLKQEPMRFGWWIGGAIAFIAAVCLLGAINRSQPTPPPKRGSQYAQQAPRAAPQSAPAVRTTSRQPTYVATAPPEPKPEPVDYIAARIGLERIPTNAQYIAGEPVHYADGLSTVTVDGTRMHSDVLVKLVRIEDANAWPVRTFFIPAGSSFTARDVTAGNYEVRYLDRDSGSTSKTEEFFA